MIMIKLQKTLAVALQNQSVLKNPGYLNTLSQIQQQLRELDRYTSNYSKKAIKAYDQTNTRRKLLNSIAALKAKNTAIDILTGLNFLPTQTVVMGGSPEMVEEHKKNILEIQGDINHFNDILQAMRNNAENQQKEIDNLKRQKEKKRALEQQKKKEEDQLRRLRKLQSDQQLCMQADQRFYGHGCSRNIPRSNNQAVELYKQSADQGNIKAIVALARLLQQGLGVQKNMRQAYRNYKIASQEQNPQALFKIAQFMQKGNIQNKQNQQYQFQQRDLKPNIKRAIQEYQSAAEAGSSQAMTHLGLMYQNGEHLAQDLVKARELYNGAAKLNNPSGLNHLGAMYFQHNRDYSKAIDYFTNASNLGSPEGKNNLGICYQFGYGMAVADQQEAFKLYKESAELNYAPAMANLGYQYIKMAKLKENRSDQEELYAEGGQWLRSAIHRDKSLVQALMVLAGLYQKGLGNDQNFKLAYKYYKMAGSKGHGKGYTKCGDLLYCGLGVIKANKTEAIQYYKKAHRAGDTQALNNLGLIYESGYDGHPPDFKKALECYETAIEDNNADAMFNLAILKTSVRRLISGKLPFHQDYDNPQQNEQQIRNLLIESAQFGSSDAKQLLIQNNLISSLDQIEKKKRPEPQQLHTYRSQKVPASNQLLSPITIKTQSNQSTRIKLKQQEKLQNLQSQITDFDHQLSLQNKKNPQQLSSTVFKNSNLTHMMTDQLFNDLPDAPKNRVSSKVERHFMQDQRLSKIEKKPPVLLIE